MIIKHRAPRSSSVNNPRVKAIAPDPTFMSEKILALSAFRDFMNYKEPGYTPELFEALEKAQSGAEIRDILRKARAAA